MPTYCHHCVECDVRLEQVRTIARYRDLPDCPKCGVPMPIDIGAQGAGGTRPSCWPLASEALGVDPSQIAEALAFDKRNGVGGTDYTPDGRPIFRDRDHRKRYMAAHGYYDRNAGYGDQSPRNRIVSRDEVKRIRRMVESGQFVE